MADEGPKRKKEVIARALIDPAFRRVLFDTPERVLGTAVSAEDRQALEQMKKLIPHLGEVVSSLASNVLCNSGGGALCGHGRCALHDFTRQGVCAHDAQAVDGKQIAFAVIVETVMRGSR